MRRAVSIGIVCFWLSVVAWGVRRTWTPSSVASAPPVLAGTGDARSVDDWMAVYHQQRKIGYTHYRLSQDGQGLGFLEESLLRITVMDAPQTVRTLMQGHLASDFALRDVHFALTSGVGQLDATGVIDGAGLRLTLRTGQETSEQRLPLSEPLYMPSALRSYLGTSQLQAGREIERVVFDPMTLKNDRIHVRVEVQEAVPQLIPEVRAWRIHEEFRGVHTTAWIDSAGGVIREEGPMGLVLVRQTKSEAEDQNWDTQTALDLIATVAVPVAHPIDDPRHRRSLRLHLSGINLETVPTDDEQTRNGATLTITRPDVEGLASYQLPCRDPQWASELTPTAFLQSDHPRIRTVAQEIVGGTDDAKAAAALLNDWVYTRLRKVPTISVPNALQVLEMGEGDCNEHAVLFAALARAIGLPAQVIAGAVYLDGAFFYHAWCEVWLGRWVSIDPALHQFPADATHVKFVVGGPEEHAAMLGIVGRLGIEVLDDDVARVQ